MQPERADHPVDRQRRVADQFGQSPGTDPPGHLHLPEPVLGVREAEGEAGVGRRLGGDVDDTARVAADRGLPRERSEEHTSELLSLMRNSYAVFCSNKKNTKISKSTH